MIMPATTVQQTALTDFAVGRIAVVHSVLLAAADASMLRAMGLRPGAQVRVCRVGEPTVLEVISGHTCRCHCRCRIGIGRAVAERVLVTGEV
jgi:Fe2+ transport system protein FeoA